MLIGRHDLKLLLTHIPINHQLNDVFPGVPYKISKMSAATSPPAMQGPIYVFSTNWVCFVLCNVLIFDYCDKQNCADFVQVSVTVNLGIIAGENEMPS